MKFKKRWKNQIRWCTKIAAFFAVAGIWLLFATCRKRFLGEVLEENHRTSFDSANLDRYVLCVWHDALLLPTFSAPRALRRQICCLVSKHQDGAYLADAMSFMDYATVRGSSKRGGIEALRNLLTDTDGKHIIITPDGPQGPRRQMKPGAVFVASQTGKALLPGAFVTNRGIRIKGRWTDLLIPLPFSTIYLISGPPISVPADLSRDQLYSYIDRAQQAMDQVNQRADESYANEPGSTFVETKRAA